MSRIVAIGQRERIEGLGLAGVEVCPVDGAEETLAAWNGMGPGVAMVILTRDAERTLSDLLSSRADLIWTRLPD